MDICLDIVPAIDQILLHPGQKPMIMKEPKFSPDEERRIENELKSLKLELNHGMSEFFADPNAPPKLVGKFLDNVAAFEAAHQRGVRVPIRVMARIGALPPADLLDEGELEGRIEALLLRLQAKGIVIDRPEHLSPRDYYRFLTEEFLEEPVLPDPPRGMIQGFIYSEFRHDGPEFIREHVEETLLDLLNLEKDFRGEWLSENCRNEKACITKAEALESIRRFRSRYRSITPVAFRPEDIRPIGSAVYFFFGVAWEGHPVGGGDPERYEDLGISQVAFEDGEWRVQGIMMPGFTF